MDASPSHLVAAVTEVAETFRQRYGTDVSSLRVSDDAPDRVTGFVATRKQLAALRNAVTEPGGSTDVEALETLLSDDPRVSKRVDFPSNHPRVPLFRGPNDDRLVTEWIPTDGPCRVLFDDRPRRLVQLRDGAVGWLDASLDTRDQQGEHGAFARPIAANERLIVSRVALDSAIQNAEVLAARSTAYKLGGRDVELGIDCSALVQLVIWQATGRMLPRHTRDQRRCGERVALGEARRGDLLYVRARSKRWMHVGLLVSADRVVHACRLDGRVRDESRLAFLTRYHFLGARRLFVPESGDWASL